MAKLDPTPYPFPALTSDRTTTTNDDNLDECGDPLECINDQDESNPCKGTIEYRPSLTGTGTAIPRCAHHWNKRLDLEDDLNQRYPINPPRDFSYLDAGEYWGPDDY